VARNRTVSDPFALPTPNRIGERLLRPVGAPVGRDSRAFYLLAAVGASPAAAPPG
jgi:hypothetical protein